MLPSYANLQLGLLRLENSVKLGCEHDAGGKEVSRADGICVSEFGRNSARALVLTESILTLRKKKR